MMKGRKFLDPNWCGVCRKVAHRTEGGAKAALRAHRRRQKAKRLRVYKCIMGCWHLGKD